MFNWKSDGKYYRAEINKANIMYFKSGEGKFGWLGCIKSEFGSASIYASDEIEIKNKLEVVFENIK